MQIYFRLKILNEKLLGLRRELQAYQIDTVKINNENSNHFSKILVYNIFAFGITSLRPILLIICIFASYGLFSQNSLIGVDEAAKDIGMQESIYKIKADYVIQNNQIKNLYLLRADADRGVTIHSSRKTLKPGDTALITVEFIPEKTGRFNESINLITSADGLPYKLSLSGTIKSIKTDDKTACFYFRKPSYNSVKPTTEPIVVTEPTKPRDVSNRMPDATETPVVREPSSAKPEVVSTPQPKPVATKPEVKNSTLPKAKNALDDDLYKPNNIIFLVDISGSMKDSSKLPVMQQALYYLIDALRPVDKITVITYADTVKLMKEGIYGTEKEELKDVVRELKAKGLTRGKKAIQFSLDVALKNYIEQGNNQIILATDGKFYFYPKDQEKFLTDQGNKKVLLSTIAFGDDKEALSNLKEIAHGCGGNFIHIKHKHKAQEQLLNEIKEHSLIR